jgi:hypothetical protein
MHQQFPFIQFQGQPGEFLILPSRITRFKTNQIEAIEYVNRPVNHFILPVSHKLVGEVAG